MLEHVLTDVFKQPKDGSLAKALDRGGIHEIFGVLSLSQSDHVNLTYVEDGSTVKPISIGHKEMLTTLKLFAAFCKAEGYPIVHWTQVTKKDFDEFRSSNECIYATERDDNIKSPAPSAVFEKKAVMTSGLVMHALIPLKWMTTSCYLVLLLLVKTKVIPHPVTHVLLPLKTMSTLHYLDHLLLLIKIKVILDLLMERLLCTIMSCLRCFANLGVGHLLNHWRGVVSMTFKMFLS